MFRSNIASDKKRALQAHKEKLLQEIKYYETRIAEFSNKSSNVYFGADSSDSEDGFPTFLDISPSISELKRQDRLLKTCLQATQELTSVTVLESEVQVLVKDPDIENEKPVSEPGLWREVTAECRIDLVPFTILFYVHQPSRRFSAASYRGLRVQAVKAAQEAEMTASVLHTLTCPADALETIRSYAAEYRSRRCTLARLADKHAGALYMQPREEGGFVLRCGSVMQMSWRLENKTLLAPFQHKMNFELEYMDESFLKIIKQAHRQLSDPSLQTDERTQLLSKIISTCIEAQGQELESDTDSKQLEKTTLDDDDSDLNVEERDREVMAPPKSIPKRSKPKGKENDDGNRKSVKRSADQVDGSVKRAKTDVNITDSENKNVNEDRVVEKTQKSNTGRLVENNSARVNAKTKDDVIPHVSDKKVSKKTSKTAQDKSDVSDPKKKKSNDLEKKTQEKVKSAKNSEVSKNDKESNEKIAGTIEQNKLEKVTVVSKNSKNTKTLEDDLSKSLKTNQTQIDAEKNSETVHASKTVKDSVSKSTVNLKDNAKKILNAEISKSKKSGTSETNNAKTVNNSNSANTKKITAGTGNKRNDTEAMNTKGVKSNSNVKKTVITDSTNSNKIAISNPAKTKKIAKPGTDNAKKTVHDSTNKEAVNPDTKNVTKPANTKKSDVTASSNAKKVVNSNSAKTKKIANPGTENATTTVNNDPNNAKKTVDTSSGNTKKVESSNSAKTKKIANPGTENGITTVSNDSNNAKKGVNAAKTKKDDPDSNVKKIVNLESDKAKKSVNSNSNKIANYSNSNKFNSDIKKNVKNDATKKPITNATKTNSKNLKDGKISKMVIKNHRNSSGNSKKMSTLKPSIGKESKIPQKKLSPAYAAVLQQNPIRISPRMLSKFKSPSDSNIQSKLFKPVTNIPRLLKKPAPKSK